MTQRCPQCAKDKPLEEFHLASQGKSGAPCKACKQEYNRSRYLARSAEHWRDKARAQNYGLTKAQLDDLREKQGGGCAVCGTSLKGLTTREEQIDHDHATGAVRGILCRVCNQTIGQSHDDIQRLRAAADYLETKAWLEST